MSRPLGVAVPFEGLRGLLQGMKMRVFGGLAVDQAAIAVGGGPATGMWPDFRLFEANSEL